MSLTPEHTDFSKWFSAEIAALNPSLVGPAPTRKPWVNRAFFFTENKYKYFLDK